MFVGFRPPGIARVLGAGAETHWLLTSANGGSVYESGDRYYTNRWYAGGQIRAWDALSVDATTADGFESGVFPDWYLARVGFLDDHGNVIAWPPTSISELANVTSVRGPLMLRTYADGFVGEDYVYPDNFENRIFEFTFTGGSGDDLTVDFYNPAHYLVNESRRKVMPLDQDSDWFYFRCTSANFGSKNLSTVRNLTLREVVDAGGGTYNPIDTGRLTTEFKDNSDHYHILYHLNTQSAVATPGLSVAGMAESGAPYWMSRPQGFLRYGAPIEDLLEEADDQGQMAWVFVPFHLCNLIRPGFLQNWTVSGVRHLTGSLDDVNRKPGTFALVPGTILNSGSGCDVTVDSDGFFHWDGGVDNLASDTYGFDVEFEDIDDNVVTAHLRFQLTSSGQEVVNTTYIDESRPLEASSELNYDTILTSPEWDRSADNLLDRIVASGYPTTKPIFLSMGGEVWNFGGFFGWDAHHAWGISRGYYGVSQGNWMKGYGLMYGRFMHAVRSRMAVRSLNYNIIFAMLVQTADSSTATNALQGATDYFEDNSLDPPDYIAPGKCEIFGTTYTENLFHPGGASGAANDADNLTWWLARIADTTAGDEAYAWLTDSTSHDINNKAVRDRWAALRTVATTFGTVYGGGYEGDDSNIVPANLRANSTFMTWWRDWKYGAQHAAAWDAMHTNLIADFAGHPLTHPPIIPNYGLAGPADPVNPWNGRVYEHSNEMNAMWRRWGRAA